MGTRNLTLVFLDGEYRIAQYGQWDGYPEGQGVTALAFARKLQNKKFREEFERKVRALSWITQDELDAFFKKVHDGEIPNWEKVYPEYTRDTCAEILKVVAERKEGLKLVNELPFAADSLWCEWAWLIDLDHNTFEGYEGFNKEPLTEKDRFFFLRDKEKDDFHAIRLAGQWDLDKLPSEAEFIAYFEKDEDEEDEEE